MIRYCAYFTILLSAASLTAETQEQSRSTAPTRIEHYVKHTFKSKDGSSIDSWIMAPAKIEKGRLYSLVLSLHGRGGNTDAATKLGSDTFREKFPCFVMAPASTTNGHWTRPDGFSKSRKKGQGTKAMLPIALEAMDELIEQHPIDPNRIYVTGQSMGGTGTFGAVFIRPKFFAAAIPVAGGWNPKDADKMKHTPLWAFHGDSDQVVPTGYSRNIVAAISKAGGSPKYTEYKGVAHNSWSQTYASPKTWEWLFKQQRTQ